MFFPEWLTHARFNYGEGCFWIAMAIFIPIRYSTSLTRSQKIATIVAFTGFGISDFIEIKTGAWWRPIRLLALKAICLTSIAFVMWQIVKNDKSKQPKQ